MRFSFLNDRLREVRENVPVGSPEYQEAKVVFAPDGNLSLEYGAIKNRQQEINSFKESCLVDNLVRRYENGDELALLRGNTGAYADLSQLPKNIHEAHKLKQNVDNLYNCLSDDIKVRYTNVNEFAEAFSTESKFADFVGFARDVVSKRSTNIQKSEVKSDA